MPYSHLYEAISRIGQLRALLHSQFSGATKRFFIEDSPIRNLSALGLNGILALSCLAGCWAEGMVFGNDPASSLTPNQSEAREALGKSVPPAEWMDYQGRRWSRQDFKDSKVEVYAFLGTECPLAQLYASKLVEIEKAFGDKGVAFVAVNPNVQDSLGEMAAQARRIGLDFPYVKDPDQAWADALGVTRTPEVCIVDSDNKLVYRGRVDDQYGIGYQRDNPGRNDLVELLTKILAGESIEPVSTKAAGCLIGRNSPPASKDILSIDKNAPSENTKEMNVDAGSAKPFSPNYAEHISPLMANRCVSCHQEGEIGPMNFTEYEDVVAWADMIMEVVHDKRMPPWHANPAHGDFENDRRLTPAEIDLLQNWVDSGKRRGDPNLDATIPPRESGWQIDGTPDLVFEMADRPFQVNARGDVAYQYFFVDPKIDKDMWMRGMEIMPGNRAVVHHILVFTRDKQSKQFGGIGQEQGFLAGYVPGTRVVAFPPGYAKRIPANHELVFQVHYTPNGTVQEDLSKIAFWTTHEDEVDFEVHTTSAMQTRLRIPPFEANYRTSALVNAPLPESHLLAMSPHMHLRGKSFRYTLVKPDGVKETLLDIPRYDFNWQTEYRLRKPIYLPEGCNILCEAVFDNSEDNLNNPDPSQTVRWGDQTYQEMMIGYFHIATKRR